MIILKELTSFRLNTKIIDLLDKASSKKGITKTQVVEEAIRQYVLSEKSKVVNPLIKYAGILPDKDADDLLKIIQQSRKNKKIKSGI